MISAPPHLSTPHRRIALFPRHQRIVQDPPQPAFVTGCARRLGRQGRLGAYHPAQHERATAEDTHGQNHQPLARTVWHADTTVTEQRVDSAGNMAYRGTHAVVSLVGGVAQHQHTRATASLLVRFIPIRRTKNTSERMLGPSLNPAGEGWGGAS